MTYARDATAPFYHGSRADLQVGDLLPPERLKEMKDALARMAAEGEMKIIE